MHSAAAHGTPLLLMLHQLRARFPGACANVCARVLASTTGVGAVESTTPAPGAVPCAPPSCAATHSGSCLTRGGLVLAGRCSHGHHGAEGAPWAGVLARARLLRRVRTDSASQRHRSTRPSSRRPACSHIVHMCVRPHVHMCAQSHMCASKCLHCH